MGRVLKIAGGVMGVVLLILMAVFGMGRAGKSMPQWMIIHGAGASSDSIRRISPDGELTTLYRFPSYFSPFEIQGSWLYGWKYQGYEIFCRINLHTGEYQPIIENIRSFTYQWSPDKKWIYYLLHNTSDPAIYRVRPNGQQRQRISPAGLYMRYQEWTFLDDGTLLFNAGDSSESPPRLHRMDRDGNLRYGLEDDFPELFFAPAGQDWIVVKKYVGDADVPLWWMSIEGGELHQFPALQNLSGFPKTMVWMEKDPILILETDEEVVAFHRDAPQPLWLVPDGIFYGFSPDQRAVLVQSGKTLNLVEIDSGESVTLIRRSLPTMYEWRWSPDGNWLYYIVPYFNGDYGLLHVSRDGQTHEEIFRSHERLSLIGWTADAKWLMFQNGEYRLHILGDGSDIQNEGFWWNENFLGWWPEKVLTWQPSILAVGGIGLVIPFFTKRRRK